MSLRVYKTVKVFKYQSHVGGLGISKDRTDIKGKILSDFSFFIYPNCLFMKLYDIITIIYLKIDQ